MSMYEGLKKDGFKTGFGSRSDLCIDCLTELMAEKKVADRGVVARELKGKLEGKIVRRLPQYGYVICEKHIEKMAAEVKEYHKE